MEDQLYHVDGSTTVISPADGEHYTLRELQGFVEGLIEVVPVPLGEQMGIANEEGLCIGMEPNVEASRLFGYPLVGPVAVIQSKRMK
jgi:hypothetical protein